MTLLTILLQAPQPPAATGMGSYSTILMIVAMIAIMYFIVYRPQVKARKKLEASIRDMKKGDRVLTSGGLYGTIVGTGETVTVLEIDKEKGIKVEINKAMIAQVFPRE